MKISLAIIIFQLCVLNAFSQQKDSKIKWIRTGFVYGFASQNTYIPQDSDYSYTSQSFKFSNHFLFSKAKKHAWEFSVDPSYYSSKHESFNFYHPYFTNSEHPEEEIARFLPLKQINEYVLNLGIMYRYFLSKQFSAYALANIGPMYLDTDTERLKKGFAFSDIFGIGINYNRNTFSLDLKAHIRHVSNANTQYPNFGFNAVGLEFGVYYEILRQQKSRLSY